MTARASSLIVEQFRIQFDIQDDEPTFRAIERDVEQDIGIRRFAQTPACLRFEIGALRIGSQPEADERATDEVEEKQRTRFHVVADDVREARERRRQRLTRRYRDERHFGETAHAHRGLHMCEFARVPFAKLAFAVAPAHIVVGFHAAHSSGAGVSGSSQAFNAYEGDTVVGLLRIALS